MLHLDLLKSSIASLSHYLEKMKPSQTKLTLSIIAIVLCVFTFIGFLYIEDAGYLNLWARSCSKQEKGSERVEQNVSSSVKEDLLKDVDGDNKEEFDPNTCSVFKGKWVFNSSVEPLYSDTTCPYLDRQFSCTNNGRPDSDYRYWEWKPDDCILPRFDPVATLEKLRGKRLMFVGDSLQRSQWQSLVCMVEYRIPPDQKSMQRGPSLSVFKAKEYNASIEFYWSPFLVESNSDLPIKSDPNDRIIRVDSVFKHAKYWVGVDIFVFNTYVWWMSGLKIKSLWGSFANGEEGFEELDAPIAYRIALKTWANWVDSTIDPNKTRVFFTTMSPTHMRSSDWNNKKGIRCYNETQPVTEKSHWGTGSDQQIMDVVTSVVGRMKVPVSFINITQMSEYRKDGHTSVYTEYQGKILTDEQKADPVHYADCIHWCLPGVPDTWNKLLYAYL
ncbi:hypothetical protein NE237_004352 [Protea cynaroides]|uniref:Trichome birefringence-like N-terminal domain-containing protein n=1 Tax=Protea cynaroides TaxID=273540 RepID=A0A9Q0KII1_9MAGN|nr:hypothetical protein NE237_004352 [Protea cynaroides]